MRNVLGWGVCSFPGNPALGAGSGLLLYHHLLKTVPLDPKRQGCKNILAAGTRESEAGGQRGVFLDVNKSPEIPLGDLCL